MTDESPIPAEALEVARVLNAAADLIEPEGAWTQGVFAKAANGNCISPRSAAAVCWCLDGALVRVSGRESTFSYLQLVREAAGCGIGAMSWNDEEGRTQAEVVAALRKAAAHLLSTKESGNG